MKVEEIVMVIENRKGVEVNYLMTFSQYQKECLVPYCDTKEEVAEQVYELLSKKEGWSNIYRKANHSIEAKCCQGVVELRQFLMGKLNQKVEWKTEESRCHPQCLVLLKGLGIRIDGRGVGITYHYSELPKPFERGMVLQNLNGSSYRVLEVLTEQNLFLMNQNTGQYTVGVGTKYYEKYPKEEWENQGSKTYGMEWSHGVYLGDSLEQIDLTQMYHQYANRPYQRRESMTEEVNTLEEVRTLEGEEHGTGRRR